MTLRPGTPVEALMPYFDGTNYHYLLSYATNGGNPITGTFESTIPETLPTPTHPDASAVFLGWYTDEQLTIPVTTGAALTRNTALYAKWALTLNQTTDNSSFISANNDNIYDITLTRTLNAGGWNTFCVPFNISSLQITSIFGEGTKVRELGSSDYDSSTKSLTLNFTNAENIDAGKPYLVYLGSASNVVNPTFNDVTIVNGTTTKETTYTNFVPVMNPTSLTANDKTVLFVTGGDKLTYPNTTGNINGFRAYFKLKEGAAAEARAFTMSFGDEETTDIITTNYTNFTNSDDAWYDLSGRKLSGRSNAKGLYIHNRQKVMIK